MDLTSTIQEKKQRLEELRRLRDQRKQKDTSGYDENDIDSLLQHVLKRIPSSTANVESSDTLTRENGTVVTESDNSYSESRIPKESDQQRTVERYEKSVQTFCVADTKTSEQNEDRRLELSSTPAMSRFVSSQATPIPIERHIATSNSITAIKKKINVMDNKEGLEQITRNMESRSLYSSVGVVERALNQMEDYDFLNEYASSNMKKQSKKELTLIKQYSFDLFHDHPVTSISISPSMKNILLVTYSDSTVGNKLNSNEGYMALWDLNITDHPYRVVSLVDKFTNASFHPFDKTILIGSLYSGCLASWIVSDNETITVNNSTENGHSMPVIGIRAINNSATSGFLTLSNDGMLCVWNQNSIFDPVLTTKLSNLIYDQQKLDFPVIPTSLSSYDNITNQFFVGNEDGKLLLLSLHDSIVAVEKILSYHSGPVTSIATHVLEQSTKVIVDNENIKNLVLTSSFDWSVCLWLPSSLTCPLLTLTCFTSYIIAVKWHPVHPLFFVVVTENNCIQLWNLLIDRTAPIHSFTVPNCNGITVVDWSDNGKKMIIGTQGGVLLSYDIKSDIVEFREDQIPAVYRLIEEMVQEASHSFSSVCFEMCKTNNTISIYHMHALLEEPYQLQNGNLYK